MWMPEAERVKIFWSNVKHPKVKNLAFASCSPCAAPKESGRQSVSAGSAFFCSRLPGRGDDACSDSSNSLPWRASQNLSARCVAHSGSSPACFVRILEARSGRNITGASL